MDHSTVLVIFFFIFVPLILFMIPTNKRNDKLSPKYIPEREPTVIKNYNNTKFSEFLLFLLGIGVAFGIIKHKYPNVPIQFLFIQSLPIWISMAFCILGIALILIARRKKNIFGTSC